MTLEPIIQSEASQEKAKCFMFIGNRWGNSGNSVKLYFGGLENILGLQIVIAAMKLKDTYSLEGKS